MKERPEAVPTVKRTERRPANQCHSQGGEKNTSAIILPKQDKKFKFLLYPYSGANADVQSSQAASGREGRRAASDVSGTQAHE